MLEWEDNWPWERLKTDTSARETFLEHFQSFIRHVASRVVQRNLRGVGMRNFRSFPGIQSALTCSNGKGSAIFSLRAFVNKAAVN